MNLSYKTFKIVFNILFIMLLSSCSSDGGSSGDNKPKIVPIVIKGVLVDGYIKGATVCVDSNEDGKCEKEETQTTTNNKGEFSLSVDTKEGKSYILLGSGGIDTATNRQFIGTYKTIITPSRSPNRDVYSVYMTPLSTLASNLYKQKFKTNSSYKFSRAINLVANSMGLPSNKLLSDPLKNKTVFEKTQIIVQTVAIISKSIKDDEVQTSIKEVFDFVMDSLSTSIGNGKHRGKLDVSQLINTLKQSKFNNKTVDIPSSVENVANENIANISKEVSSLSGDTVDTSKLIAIQKNTQAIITQNLPIQTPKNEDKEDNTTTEDSNATNKDANTTTTTPAVITSLTIPVLTVTPKFTKENSVQIEVKGKIGALLFVNNVKSGILSGGIITITLDTSGVDGNKNFKLKLQADDINSSELDLKIKKDTVPPPKNATIDNVVTTDSTPSLNGNMPLGSSSEFIIKIKINSITYVAINNGGSTWNIADNKIAELGVGSHDVTIIVTDEAGNTSSFVIADKIKIDNSGFLVDLAIEGVKYISGKYSGYTDKDGLFKYDENKGVAFYIGDETTGIALGSATQKTDPNNDKRKVITLFDLAGSTSETDKKVLNMGKFLQSLDADGDSSNGITIDAKTKESIALLNLKNRLTFDMDVEAFHNHTDIYDLFNDLADHFGEHRGLIDTSDAKAHLVEIRDGVAIGKSLGSKRIRTKKQEIKILDGVFLSAGGVVEGLEYRSGNQFGRTDKDGKFKYEDGKKVKFYIYQLELGITEAKPIITPADLVVATSFNHPKPRNIIRLLNAFDKPNSSNILIDDAVREALEKYRSQIDINLPDGKANAELGIAKGEDEFGAQFEDFEIGKDILDEIDTIRRGN